MMIRRAARLLLLTVAVLFAGLLPASIAQAQIASSPPGINGPPLPTFLTQCPAASALACIGSAASPIYNTSNQGAPTTAASAWPFYLTQGGAALSGGNPTFVQLTAGSALVGKIGIDQTTPGTTNGVVVNASALPTGAATSVNQSTQITAEQSTASTVASGPGGNMQRLMAAIFYQESNSALAAAGVYTGAAHNTGYGSSTPTPFAYFTAAAFADQAGTLSVQCSLDATNYYQIGTASVTANSSVVVKVPAVANVCRAVFTNGTTAQTKFFIDTMFSAS